MKQVIVLAAVIPLMLVFFLQFALDSQNSAKEALVSEYVNAAKEEARQQGGFTPQICTSLKTRLSGALGIDPSDVIIEADAGIIYRVSSADPKDPESLKRGLIHYKVSVPVGKMMAGRSLFGLREGSNTSWYVVEGSAASERLRK